MVVVECTVAEAVSLFSYVRNCLLQVWQFPANSMHYLLGLWQRMVAPVPYVKASEPHLLETYTPEVNKAYIMSRLDLVAVVRRSAILLLLLLLIKGFT